MGIFSKKTVKSGSQGVLNNGTGGGSSAFNPISSNGGIIVGDSITARAWSTLGGGSVSVVVNNGIGSFTVAGHVLMTGQVAQMVTWASIPEQIITATRTGPNTFTAPVTGAANGTYNDGYIMFPTNSVDYGWYNWAQFFSNGALQLKWNAAVAGETSAQIAARYQADVLAKAPAWISLMCGINDVFVIGAIATFNNIKTMVDQTVALGIPLFLHTVLPLGNGNSANTAANKTQLDNLNRMIRSYALQKNGVYLVDSNYAFTNPLDTTGAASSGLMLIDLLHPNNNGAQLVGLTFWNAAKTTGLFNTKYQLPWSIVDNRLYDSQSLNLWAYLPGNTSGGNAGAGITGTIPQGFSVARFNGGGTHTAVCSVVARTLATDGDTSGYNLQAVLTAANASDEFTFTQNSSTWASYVSSGNTYRFVCSFRATNVSGSNLSGVRSYLTFTINAEGQSTSIFTLNFNASSNFTSDFAGTIMSAPILFNYTSISGLTWIITCKFSAASSTPVTVAIGRVGIIQQNTADAVVY